MDQETLKRMLHYDSGSGVFTWIDSECPRGLNGKIAGSIKKHGATSYVTINLTSREGGGMLKAHRLAWLYVYGEWPIGEIDHQDGNGLNNSIGNLVDSTHIGNCRNMKRSKINTSGYTGVGITKYGKWMAYINGDNGREFLGCFAEKTDAVKARQAAEIKYNYHPNHGKR